MIVLGIDTSCDETAVGIVKDGREVLVNLVSSQVDLHRPFGGVVPEIASRSHLKRLVPVLAEALDQAGLAPENLDALSATNRPGLIGALLVGLSGVKALAWLLGKPFLGVDHVQAHAHAAAMADPNLPLPYLCLVASGGHTSLYLVKEPGVSTRLGRTLDDAAGEALDKAAAILGLGYPGGPAIEEFASQARATLDKPFPIPLKGRPGTDFSFSGLKTAMVQRVKGMTLDPEMVANLAKGFQEAVVTHLTRQCLRAAKETNARALAIGGGVARNLLLRQRLQEQTRSLHLSFPPLDLCSDNGAMIAGLASVRFGRGEVDSLEIPAAPRSKT